MTVLTVARAFGDYAKGARITDPQKIAQILKSHAAYVVVTRVPDDSKFSKPNS